MLTTCALQMNSRKTPSLNQLSPNAKNMVTTETLSSNVYHSMRSIMQPPHIFYLINNGSNIFTFYRRDHLCAFSTISFWSKSWKLVRSICHNEFIGILRWIDESIKTYFSWNLSSNWSNEGKLVCVLTFKA